MSGTLNRRRVQGTAAAAASTGPRSVAASTSAASGTASALKARGSGSNENVKCASPKRLVPKGTTLREKLKIVSGLDKKNEDGTWNRADFLMLKELACDPSNWNGSISTEDEEDSGEDTVELLGGLGLEDASKTILHKKLDFQDDNDNSRSDNLADDNLPQVVKDVRAFDASNEEFWAALRRCHELESAESRMETWHLLEEIVVELETNVLPSLNKALKKPVAPNELMKGINGAVLCNYEDQSEFIEAFTTLSSACEQLSQVDCVKINLKSEIKYLAQKIAYLETKVTEQTVEKINFQKLKALLEKLSEDRTPKSE